MSTQIQEITAGHAAKRYAEALTMAAGAEQKIAELTEAVKDAEYLRLIAEMQLEAISWPEGLGQVLHAGTDEPGSDVESLIDLYSGQVWTRFRNRNGTVVADHWVKADAGAVTTRYEWPLEEAGPFIMLKDSWFLNTLTRDTKAFRDADDAIHEYLRSKAEYRQDESSWLRPSTADAVKRVVDYLERQFAKQGGELHETKYKLQQAEADLARYKEAEEAAA